MDLYFIPSDFGMAQRGGAMEKIGFIGLGSMGGALLQRTFRVWCLLTAGSPGLYANERKNQRSGLYVSGDPNCGFQY